MTSGAREVDVAILGAGTAGLTAHKAAKKAGASVLVIDPGPFGTTCARVGCMPSKLLIAAADVAHGMREGATFGVRAERVVVDGRAVLERVRRERDRFVGFALRTVEGFDEEGELLRGRAKIAGQGVLRVDDAMEVRFRSLVVATGTDPFVPPAYRDLPYLTNDTVFELAGLPESLLVVGSGAIGLELGQAFHRLGVRTTILGVRGVIGPLRDPEVRAEARRVLSAELDLHPEHALDAIERDGAGVRARFVDSTGTERDERFARVLVAAGRRAPLGALGLDVLGVAPGPDGRWPIDPATLQLGALPVFVAGDANRFHLLMHEAADDGRRAGENAARFPELRATPRRAPLEIVFTDPQIAIVGGGFEAARVENAVAGSVDFAGQGRARIHAENRGRARVYAERDTGRLLGAELAGPRAEHLGHLLAWAVQRGVTVEEALAMPFYHPVVEEGLRTALQDLAASLRQGDGLASLRP